MGKGEYTSLALEGMDATDSKQCSTRGYKWIDVDVTTVLSRIQVDTCRRRQGIQVWMQLVRATCIRCKRGIRLEVSRVPACILLEHSWACTQAVAYAYIKLS